jgi:EamA-like transporter family
MKVAPGPRFKTYWLILLLVCFGPVGDLCMSKGMRAIGTAPSWAPWVLVHYAFRVFSSPLVWVGALAMIGFFLSYTTVLSWADYSYVQPATALTYGLVALLGKYLLGETITPLRWSGVVIVCIGVLVIGYTPPRTTEPVDPPRHATREPADVL